MRANMDPLDKSTPKALPSRTDKRNSIRREEIGLILPTQSALYPNRRIGFKFDI